MTTHMQLRSGKILGKSKTVKDNDDEYLNAYNETKTFLSKYKAEMNQKHQEKNWLFKAIELSNNVLKQEFKSMAKLNSIYELFSFMKQNMEHIRPLLKGNLLKKCIEYERAIVEIYCDRKNTSNELKTILKTYDIIVSFRHELEKV